MCRLPEGCTPDRTLIRRSPCGGDPTRGDRMTLLLLERLGPVLHQDERRRRFFTGAQQRQEAAVGRHVITRHVAESRIDHAEERKAEERLALPEAQFRALPFDGNRDELARPQIEELLPIAAPARLDAALGRDAEASGWFRE